MVSQNSSKKSSSQSPSIRRVGFVASRRDSCSTLLMMVLTRSELLRMMSVSRRSSGPMLRAFGQQLAGMAHRADGIADFMGDAGGQPAERGKLALLHALGHEAGVLEKDQRGPGHAAQAVRNAAESRARRRRRRSSTGEFSPCSRLSPSGQGIQQARRNLAHQGTRNGVIVAENFRRRFVDETNLIGGVDDQQAFAQMLHDVLGQLREIRQIDVFLANQLFALAHAAGGEARCSRDGEQHHAKKPAVA